MGIAAYRPYLIFQLFFLKWLDYIYIQVFIQFVQFSYNYVFIVLGFQERRISLHRYNESR